MRFARSERADLVGVVCGANPERKLKLVLLTGWHLAAALELDVWAAWEWSQRECYRSVAPAAPSTILPVGNATSNNVHGMIVRHLALVVASGDLFVDD